MGINGKILNKYLGGIRFSGATPHKRCVARHASEIKQVEVTILAFSMSLGSLLKEGQITVSDLACEDISIDDVTLNTTRPTQNKVSSRVRQGARLEMRRHHYVQQSGTFCLMVAIYSRQFDFIYYKQGPQH